MRVGSKTVWTLAAAGLFASAGCAGKQEKEQASPAVRQIEASQARSQQALDEAAAAQRRAAEQSQRAQEARQAAQKAEADLRAAEQRATAAARQWREEQQRAVQAQQQASRATEQASRVAQQAQAQASQGLAEQSPRQGAAERTISGQVTEAGANRIVITPGNGTPQSFGVTQRTEVQIDGRRASLEELQPGADARVAYDPASGAAVRVEVRTDAAR